jgi:hypothetical protein
MNNTSMFKILWAKQPAKFFLILSVSALFCLSSCNKASLLGLDVQPENDLIDAQYVDSLTLLTQATDGDSLRTDGNWIASNFFLGKYQDPIFGQSSASIYSQVRLISNAPNFGKDPVCESVTLSLLYDTLSGMYGKKQVHKQTLSVYELIDNLDIASAYYSNQHKAKGSTDLANYVFTPNPKKSVIVDKDTLVPQVRIPLPASFGQKILSLDSTSLATNENFMKIIKGFYITTENTTGLAPSEGNLMQFLMASSTLAIRYKYKVGTTTVDSTYKLTLAGCARFMHFEHPYKTGGNPSPDLLKQLSTSTVQNDVCYVQGMGGVKTRVKIPNIVKWGQKDFIAINKAELLIQSTESRKDTFALPPSLSLYAINDDGKTLSLLPDALSGANSFGGGMDTTGVDPNYTTYHFTITRYVQQLISENRLNNGLYITASGSASSPYRFVLGGGTATLPGGGENKYQMKLRITYTKLK